MGLSIEIHSPTAVPSGARVRVSYLTYTTPAGDLFDTPIHSVVSEVTVASEDTLRVPMLIPDFGDTVKAVVVVASLVRELPTSSWSGGSSLPIAITYELIPNSVTVPGDIEYIQDAINTAGTWDVVYVAGRPLGTAYQEPISLTRGVKVVGRDVGNGFPILMASTDSVAVAFATDAISTSSIENFTILGGTSRIVDLHGSASLRNCTLDGTSTGPAIGINAASANGQEIVGCSVLLDTGTALVLGGSALVDSCSFEVATSDTINCGVLSTGTGTRTLFRSTVEAAGGDGVACVGGTTDLVGSTISNAAYGIVFSGSAGGSVDSCSVSGFLNTGISVLASGTTLQIHNNTIDIDGGLGIATVGSMSGVSITDNHLTGNASSVAGIQLGASAGSPTLSGNHIEKLYAGEGISIASGTAVLTGNYADSCNYAIHVTGGTPSIGTASSSSDNTVTGSVVGIRVVGSGTVPVIRNNQIVSNTTGLLARSNAAPDLGTGATDLGNNSFLSNSSYCIRNTSTGTGVLAYGNWFGSCAAPGCTNGNVVTIGYLCSAPAAFGLDVALVANTPAARVLSVSPNPTTAGTTVRLAVSGEVNGVSLQVFDITGRRIRVLPGLDFGEGTHSLVWDGKTDAGMPASQGIYFLRVAGSNLPVHTSKVLVIR